MMKSLRNVSDDRANLKATSDEYDDDRAVEDVAPLPDRGWRSTGGRLVGTLQIVGVLAATALAVYLSREPAVPIAPSGMTAATAPIVPKVSVITPRAGAQKILVAGNGSVGVTAYVDLVPQISGRIEALSPAMRVGGAFRAGETLVAIEPDDFLLQVKQAQADVAVQRANLRLQQARSDAAVKNYALLNPGKAVPNLVALRPQIAQAAAQLRSAEARAEVALLALERTQFSLPFDGMITESSAQVGQLITGGRAFGQAYAKDSVELVVSIAPDELAQLAPAGGRRVIISTSQQNLEARIDRVSAQLDNRSRFAKAYIPLPQTSDRASMLQPGTFADVIIEGPEYSDTLVIPEAAMQADDIIWYVQNGRLVSYQPVVLGRNDQGIVIAGRDVGDGIVVGTLANASAGMAVSATPIDESLAQPRN
ncbi:efflux RND transporter periplasmic adaptor subunit [Pseudomonadales bacterium]|nr:efflux RND transporter periplasmic adaptor subunit [Pseudomonadales bacterium]